MEFSRTTQIAIGLDILQPPTFGNGIVSFRFKVLWSHCGAYVHGCVLSMCAQWLLIEAMEASSSCVCARIQSLKPICLAI